MIRQLTILLLAVGAAVGLTACAETYGYGRTRETRVSVAGEYAIYDDYDALAPYGTWVAVSYGWAWCPLDVSAEWRPYTVGRWAYTDYGWMWLSADPWGSTPYHYGRWAYDDYYGWVWIPGDVWAPAWVSWRYGGDWIGWAPLPPDLGWQVSVGFRYSSSDIDRRIDPQAWCFTRASGFTDTRVRVAPAGRNVTLRDVTRNVTRYEIEGSMPAERGLRPEWVSRATGRSVTRYRLEDAPAGQPRRNPDVRDNEIVVSRTRPRPANRGDGSDRVRANPPTRYRAAPERALIERQRAERERAPERLRQERQELEQEQQQELRERPRGVSEETLRRRHEAERRAQDAREERMRRVFEKRQEKFEREDRDRGRGRERGRGRGDD
ncbi:MAG TPA: DUF6600 domain-containing protein [Candidatus Eisenbacteria bacterium]|nr:DUF6600 domain-containing protein [Candidatus Eisenbacteria bacterium]